MPTVPQIRVFLASPGDVNEERAVALRVLGILEYDPLFRREGAGGVSIQAVAWDRLGAGPAMRAAMTPQTAILRGLPRPSQCDIVLVFFWGRMGTPLPHPEYQKPDDSPYLSGTEWEYLDAVTAEREHGKPITLIYRRSQKPRIDRDNPEEVDQYQKVQAFFKQFRDPKTRALLGGFNEYLKPADLGLKLLVDLRPIINDILFSGGVTVPKSVTSGPVEIPVRPPAEAPPAATSPSPGLRASPKADPPIVVEPEQRRLLIELEQIATGHERRRDIGDRLAVIGDTRPGVGEKDGVPDLLWLPVDVSPGPVTITTDEKEIGPITIPPFFIAKYQITYAQFQAFRKAKDGFDDDRWWEGMPDEYKKQAMAQQRTKIANAPRDSISWYQSVAFARWVNDRLRGLEVVHPSHKVLRVGENADIRLPLEWEWQWAAQGGAKARAFPWGDWQEGFANTSEAGLSRTTAVGTYPRGAADGGALDLAGNLFEWCQSDYSKYQIVDGYSNGERKVLRGGSFDNLRSFAAASYRDRFNPYRRNIFCGVRLVVAAPILSLTSGHSDL